MTQDEVLVRVASRYFVAGFVMRDGFVVKAAPILRYMIGWPASRAVGYVEGKGWVHDCLRETSPKMVN